MSNIDSRIVELETQRDQIEEQISLLKRARLLLGSIPGIKGKSRLTEETKAAILDHLRANPDHTLASIGSQYGASTSMVQTLAKSAGIVRYQKHPEQIRKEVRAATGTNKQIAEKFAVSESTVAKWRKAE